MTFSPAKGDAVTVPNHSTLRFDLEIGKPQNGELTMGVPIGFAIKPSGADFYVIRLWMYPGYNYFLKRHDQEEDRIRYTLYARKCESPGAIRFANPVGMAELSPFLKNYLELRFRFPSARAYMSLHPCNKYEESVPKVLNAVHSQDGSNARRPWKGELSGPWGQTRGLVPYRSKFYE